MTPGQPAGAPALEPETMVTPSGRILPFAKPGELLPSDRQAISRFAATQPRAQLQFAELDKGRTIALLEIGVRRLRVERRGATVAARMMSGGPPLESDSIDELLTAVQARLSASGCVSPFATGSGPP